MKKYKWYEINKKITNNGRDRGVNHITIFFINSIILNMLHITEISFGKTEKC